MTYLGRASSSGSNVKHPSQSHVTVVPWLTGEVAVERKTRIHIHTLARTHTHTLLLSRARDLYWEQAGRRQGKTPTSLSSISQSQMPGMTQALSPNGENNNDIIPDSNGTNIIPYRKNTVRGERAYRYTTAITTRRPLYKETSALSDLQSTHLAENIKIIRFNPCFPNALALGTPRSHHGCVISNSTVGLFLRQLWRFPDGAITKTMLNALERMRSSFRAFSQPLCIWFEMDVCWDVRWQGAFPGFDSTWPVCSLSSQPLRNVIHSILSPKSVQIGYGVHIVPDTA